MSEYAVRGWPDVEAFCYQTNDDRLFLTDYICNKCPAVDAYRKLELSGWARDTDLCGYISNERNPWHLAHFEKPLR